jgi:hypothetical protein
MDREEASFPSTCFGLVPPSFSAAALLLDFLKEFQMTKLGDTRSEVKADEPTFGVAGHLIVAFGSTANNLIAFAGTRAPDLLRCAIGLDGEHNLQMDGEPFTINNGGAEDWERVRAWHTLPVVKNDALLAQVEIPVHMGAGAGRQRLLGHVRYHTKRAVFVTRVKDTVRALLASTPAQGAAQRTIFHAHFVSTMVGGTGAGCLPVGALDTLVAIHEEVPAVHVHATAHLLGPSCFGGLSREKERKMQRSTDGLLCELIYLQDAGHLHGFAEHMEVFLPDTRGRLLDEIVEYAGSNSRNVTFSLPETFARVEANIKAAFHSAWSWIHIEREECNRNGRADLTPQHIVSNAQASLATIPALLPEWFGQRWLVGVAVPLLARADVSELTGEVTEALAALDVDGVFHKATSAPYQKLAREILEEAETSSDREEGAAALVVFLEKKLQRLGVLVSEHFRARTKKHVDRWVLSLAGRHTSIEKLSELLKQVMQRLGEAKARAEAEAQRLEKAAGDGPTRKRRFFRSSDSGVPGFVQARAEAAQVKAAGEAVGLYLQEVEAWVERLEALAEGLRVAALTARKLAAKSEEVLRSGAAVVVRPAEVAGLGAALQAFLVERGDAPSAVSLTSLLQGKGAIWLKARSDKVAESVQRQLAAESVCSFVAALKLSFNLEAWLRERLQNLGGTSPLVAPLIPPNEDEQTVVVVQGADFMLVERLLQENPRLRHQLEVVQGTEPGTVLVVRGYYHAPIDAMAARAPAQRAVAEYCRHHPNAGRGAKKPLDTIQASCGPLQPAHSSAAGSRNGPAASPSQGPGNGQATSSLGQANY